MPFLNPLSSSSFLRLWPSTFFCLGLTALVVLNCGSVWAAEPKPELVEGHLASLQSKLGKGAHVISKLHDIHFWEAQGEGVSSSLTKVEGLEFQEAVRVNNPQEHHQAWNAQLGTSFLDISLKKGDVLHFSWYDRMVSSSDETGLGVYTVYAQRPKPPHWTSLGSLKTVAGPDWRQHHVTWVCPQDFEAGTVNLTFHLAMAKQCIEFGGFALFRCDPEVDRTKLPKEKVTYLGQALDAPWRKAARERIDKYRKGPFRWKVTDAEGKVMPHAKVKVQLAKHAFPFGTFELPLEDSEDAKIHREKIKTLFTAATTPTYWADWGWAHPEKRKEQFAKAQWYRDQGIPFRGHPIIYPGWRWLPSHVVALKHQPEILRQCLLDHVDQITRVMAPLGMTDWDVTNELRELHELTDIFGLGLIKEWFEVARKNMPETQMYINENTILSGPGDHERDHYRQLIKDLLAIGTPVQGIGMQGHFGGLLSSPDKVYAILDDFAQFNLPIRITEHDINIDDEQAQADYTRDFLTICFSHPSVVGFTFWGFWEGKHWRPSGAMFRRDWTPKASAKAYQKLLKETWHTELVLESDAYGYIEGRGFYGEYELVHGDGRVQNCRLEASLP